MCEMPKAFSTKTRKARKPHICCECNHAINPGEEYQYSSGIWDEPERHLLNKGEGNEAI